MKRRLVIHFLAGTLVILALAFLFFNILQKRLATDRQGASDESSYAQSEEESGAVLVVPNKSRLVAKVLEVEKSEFPKVLLMIEILESREEEGSANLLEEGEIIRVTPNYIYEYADGTSKLLYDHPLNIQNFVAYYLCPGDKITAIASAKSLRWDLSWSIMEIERLETDSPLVCPAPSAGPLSIIPNKSIIMARVLKTERSIYPEVHLLLLILIAEPINGSANLLKPEMTIVAIPYFLFPEEEFWLDLPQNVKNLAAYYLMAGDIIKGEISAREVNGEVIWVLFDLERSA